MRYDKVFTNRVERALLAARGDLEAFFRDAIDLGMDPSMVEQVLLDDLASDGPIFGKFLNNITGAATSSTAEAIRQGDFIGQLHGSRKLAGTDVSVLSDSDIRKLALSGDAELAEQYKDAVSEHVEFMWVSDFAVNTCDRCLPLHGSVDTMRGWESRGLHPSTIHSGWNSRCHCQLVRSDKATDELSAPLARSKLESKTGLKGNRRTARSVTQQDIDKARAAVEKAKESLTGRRTLRLLGQANAGKKNE